MSDIPGSVTYLVVGAGIHGLSTVSGTKIARVYRRTGPRIFARNIRGFLGSTEINKGMRYRSR